MVSSRDAHSRRLRHAVWHERARYVICIPGRLLTASSHACPAFEGHFYLTALLMPALLAGRDSSPDGYVRVITTSSSAAYRYTLNWDSFKAGAARRKMSPRTLYCQSKFVRALEHCLLSAAISYSKADVVFARQLAKRYGEKGIVSISCNPGQRVVCATSDE